jgi:hypothetical protein
MYSQGRHADGSQLDQRGRDHERRNLVVEFVLVFLKLVYYPTRFVVFFWVLEAAVTVSAVTVNVLIQLVINLALPFLSPEEDIQNGVVVAGTVLVLLSILLPLLALIPSVLHLASDVWSSDELPATRLTILYLRKGIDAAVNCTVHSRGTSWENLPSWNEQKNSIPWLEIVIKVFKSMSVIITLFVSWVIGGSRMFEEFFLLGWHYGLVMFGCWIMLAGLVQLKANYKRQVKFPSMNLVGVMAKKCCHRINSTKPYRSMCKLILFSVMVCNWIAAVFVGSQMATELDLPIGTTVASLLIITCGLALTYYMIFSSNKPPRCYRDLDTKMEPNQRRNICLLGLNYPTSRDLVRYFCAFLGFFLVLTLVLVAATHMSKDHRENDSCKSGRFVMELHKQSNGHIYDICSRHWFDLNIVDLAILADISYLELDSNGHVDCSGNHVSYQSLDQLFPEWQWRVLGRAEKHDRVGFYELYSATRNVTVLTVRGTRFAAAQDILQDIDLYTEDTVADIVYYSSFLERVIYHTGRHYHTAVNMYVEERSSHWGGRAVITGHSLGGAVGKISGSRYSIRTVAFNSPGLLFSRRKFGLSRGDINEAVVNVVAKLDIISEVDKLGGSSNHIGCTKDSILNCHRMSNMICDLVHFCQVNSTAAQIACKSAKDLSSTF